MGAEGAPTPAQTRGATSEPDHSVARPTPHWRKYGVPTLVVLLAIAVVVTVTRDWNSWEGGQADQTTDDAYVHGDITALSTKVAGLVKSVAVSDFQSVHKGDLLVQLDDDDYKAEVAQASAAVEVAKAAIQDNLRQQEHQDAVIERALAGVDQANAEIAAARAGEDAVQADVVRTKAERNRQEALVQSGSATQQTVEQAVADEQRFSAQLTSREADLDQAKALLQSNTLAVEAERRNKAVFVSQQAQLVADLHVKQAALTLAQVNLGYTEIVAPSDGTLSQLQVHLGQLVSPGTDVVSFVPLVKWVQANYRETQLTNMKVGDLAEIRIDEFPGRVVQGRVNEIAPASGSQFALLPPDNATGNYTKVVQRIPVKIELENSDFATGLRPGLSVIATVRTRHR
jgi:membrane fusion protein, multidrug efflux system